MNKAISLLSVSFTSTNAQAVFKDQPCFEKKPQSQNSFVIVDIKQVNLEWITSSIMLQAPCKEGLSFTMELTG
jgi:hypothetical protein